MFKKMKERQEKKNYKHIVEALEDSMKNSRLLNSKTVFSKLG